MKQNLLIVGAGMAAAYLLQELQALGGQARDYRITVVGDEEDLCYNRVLLSNVLAGENDEADLAMLEKSGAVTFVPGVRIERVSTDARLAFGDDGNTYPYDKLVLATGSRVARPPTDSAELAGVHVFRSLADARTLRSRAAYGKKAVVIGGGLLGLEAAHGLSQLGFDTSVVHRNQVLMNRQLDVEGGMQLQFDLEQRGIRFSLRASLQSIRAIDNEVCEVQLDDGSTLPCDLLLFASGIVPNTDLARDAGIEVGHGIRVDARLQTSSAAVFALGECCEYGQQGFGLVAPIRRQAAVLARSLCGVETESFALEDYPTQLKISGIDIYRAGELDDSAEQVLLRDPARGLYRRLVIRDNRLIGAVLVGDKRGGTWYAELIREGRDISTLRKTLIYGRDIAETQLASAA